MAYFVARRDNENPDQLLVRFNKATSHFTKLLRRSKHRPARVSPLKRRIGAMMREGFRMVREKKKFYTN